MPTVKCPTCNAPVDWRPESTYRPFCSERCRLIDLGAWAGEEHRIPGRAPSPLDDEHPSNSSADWVN